MSSQTILAFTVRGLDVAVNTRSSILSVGPNTEIRLPSISALMENTRIREQDAFTLVLRLQAPASEASDFNESGKQLVDRSAERI